MRDLRKWESDGVLTGNLSSWQRSAFTADEVTFSSMEQYMMANVIQQLNKPTLVIAHNKTFAAQLYGEFKEFFPENAVEYFASY